MTDLSQVKALTFDVFGTVVDWRSAIIREGEAWSREKGLNVDWAAFADAWRSGYGPSLQQVRTGELPWTHIDALHRMILDELLVQFNITGLSEAEIDHLNRVWHRLEPWPDAVSGLTRLRERYIVATLSNGNMALLVNMAKNAGLPWDCILSAELARRYKPDWEVYQTAADLLGLYPGGHLRQPYEVMMVAAHNGDLLAARRVGFPTAFVLRATEHGPDQTTDLYPVPRTPGASDERASARGHLREADPSVDVVATDFNDLADKLMGS